ncbi:Uncharacterised protein [Serratia fonticola]|uniref:Uncharacterized protein n=1 Tax=Serratia fonticola TaxID=47917 RepID=A0A4U9WKC0_SERFO|nr:Uncharacterised protein [Serratia fonticola]
MSARHQRCVVYRFAGFNVQQAGEHHLIQSISASCLYGIANHLHKLRLRWQLGLADNLRDRSNSRR